MPSLTPPVRLLKLKIHPSYVLGAAATSILALINIFSIKGLLTLDFGKSIYFGEDSTFNLAIIKRISEGWIYNNTRMGYPFGSNLSDYPIADFASLGFFKLLSIFGLNPVIILNTYFFISFPLTFIITMAVVRRLNFSIYISGLISILFTLLPFHFERFGIGHLFYTWYFVIPLYVLIAADAAGITSSKIFDVNSRNGVYKLIVTSIILAWFGVYYAFFGIILLTSTALFISKKSDLLKLKPIAISIITTLATLFFVLVPNIVYRITNGTNALVASRNPAESEFYGLKFVQFILPNYEHRIEYFRKIANFYASNFPLINENMMSSLGLLGSTGLLYLILKTIQIFAGGSKEKKSIKFYAFNFWVLFMFATVGGFGAVFALAVSPQIRGWNRIGIFISFFALLGLATLIKELNLRLALPKMTTAILASLLLIGGIADTMPRTCGSCIEGNARYSEIQGNFINRIESSVPIGSAIFQYPYTQFPEVPMTNVMDSYSQLEGFVFSKSLKWSSGGIKGREGDTFFTSLAAQSLYFQYQTLMKLGFNTIYIDSRGYKDGGQEIIGKWKSILKKDPDLVREDGKIYVFYLPQEKPPFKKPVGISLAQELTDFGPNGFTYPSKLGSEFFFARPGVPSFLTSFSGLSNPESWGRWSDARISRNVEFLFSKPLPVNFELNIKIFGYETNVGRTLQIISGDEIHEITLSSSPKVYKLMFGKSPSNTRSITFKIPSPISPSEHNGSGDNRLLGVGFISLRVIPLD